MEILNIKTFSDKSHTPTWYLLGICKSLIFRLLSRLGKISLDETFNSLRTFSSITYRLLL